jgi:hypothetical protein
MAREQQIYQKAFILIRESDELRPLFKGFMMMYMI